MRRPITYVAATILVTPALLAVVTAPAHAAARHCHGLEATIVGTPRGELLQGTSGDDVIVGLAGGDIIWGNGGHDVICGNRGGDFIRGGDGSDRIYGKRGSDTLLGEDGNDLLFGGTGFSTSFNADTGDDVWHSSSENDDLAYHAAMTVDLEAGTATGQGNDSLRLGIGIVTVHGTAEADTIYGSERQDVVLGGGGDDTIDGRGGNDTLVLEGDGGIAQGGAGDDNLQTELKGNAVLDGGDGDDFFQPMGGVQVVGGPGDDTVRQLYSNFSPLEAPTSFDGGLGSDTLGLEDIDHSTYDHIAIDMTAGTLDADGTVLPATGFENLSVVNPATPTTYDVTGTDGPNIIDFFEEVEGQIVIHGLDGDDTMSGGSGDDSFFGGLGDDTADGLAGTDTCTSVEHATSCEVVNP
jgi:Ca2+-binding RTX toxin-like protein